MAVYRDSAGVLRDDQGFTGGGAIDPNTAFKVVQPDEQNSANLDLTGNNAILIPIGDGKGIIGVDVTGLTGSGATIVCEMQVGDTWKPSNMLVNGTGGAFTQMLTADGQFRASSAAKWTTRIRVSVSGTGTARVSWALSTAASVIQFGAPLPPGTNALGSMIVTSLPAVTFASAQPVTLPAGTSVGVSNFPTSFNVGNFPASFQVSNFPTTQPVSGTVTANVTFPASQAVTGTFWQATQPISAVSLPLPAGAATAAGITSLSGQFPATLGAKTGANSMSVVLASDQASLPVVRRAVANIATGQVTGVAQAAKLVIPARATRYNAVLTTGSTGVFYVGNSDVSPTTGLRIASGGYYTHEAVVPLYVYAESGTMTFTYLDEYA